jgi:hypothetical protein
MAVNNFTVDLVQYKFTATVVPGNSFSVTIDGVPVTVTPPATNIVTATQSVSVVDVVENGIISILAPSVITVDTYSGNGVATQFQLTVPPVDDDNVQVVVGGVVQVPGDSYTTTVTNVLSTVTAYIVFSEPPPVGTNNITARYYSVLIAKEIKGDPGSPGATGPTGPPGSGGGTTGTWATLGDKVGPSGPTSISLGKNVTVGGSSGVTIGNTALTGSGASVAIGNNSRAYDDGVGIGNGAKASAASVSIGPGAGTNSIGGQTVNIGYFTGNIGQGRWATAIGEGAGQTNQGTRAFALGTAAGQTNQGSDAVALGSSAGYNNQGQYSIAIGNSAGYTTASDRTIILNASGSPLNSDRTDAFFVKPVRAVTSVPAGFKQVYYNPTTGEMVYLNV